jgi:hypothetical protein
VVIAASSSRALNFEKFRDRAVTLPILFRDHMSGQSWLYRGVMAVVARPLGHLTLAERDEYHKSLDTCIAEI